MQNVLSGLMFTALLRSQKIATRAGFLEGRDIDAFRPGLFRAMQGLPHGEPDSGMTEIYRLPISIPDSLKWPPVELLLSLMIAAANSPEYSPWPLGLIAPNTSWNS